MPLAFVNPKTYSGFDGDGDGDGGGAGASNIGRDDENDDEDDDDGGDSSGSAGDRDRGVPIHRSGERDKNSLRAAGGGGCVFRWQGGAATGGRQTDGLA